MKTCIDIQLVDNSVETPDFRQIRHWVDVGFTVLERSPLALTVRIVGEEEMVELNRRYRGQNQPTNVLSFPFEPLFGVCEDSLGDIVVCGPVVSRESAIQKKSLMGHWAHMIVHGMLHLFGYDHQSDQEATVMETLEISVLDRLGFSNPYMGNSNTGAGLHA